MEKTYTDRFLTPLPFLICFFFSVYDELPSHTVIGIRNYGGLPRVPRGGVCAASLQVSGGRVSTIDLFIRDRVQGNVKVFFIFLCQ